jgi:hypothetical protein
MDRLDVRCVGSSTLLGHGLHGQPVSSIGVLRNNSPILLVGCGGGVVRSAVSRLGTLPPVVFLPSVKLSCMSDLQVYIQFEAMHHRRVKVYAAGDVLDKAVALLDEAIVSEVREFVEFLQVEPGIATSLNDKYCMMIQRANGLSLETVGSYNMVMMDMAQRPLLSVLDGPLTVNGDISLFRTAPCCVVNLWGGFRIDALKSQLGQAQTRIVVIGYAGEQPPSDFVFPAIPLRPGDTFSVPQNLTGADMNNGEPEWISRGEASRGHYPPGTPSSTGMTPVVRGKTPTTARFDEMIPPRSGFDDHPRPASRGTSPKTGARQHYDPTGQPVPSYQRPRTASPAISAPSGGTVSVGGDGAPKKLYVFNNEYPDAEPVIVMLMPKMKLAALKAKISQLLNLRPMGNLYTVDTGMIRLAEELNHTEEVVATKHAGAPFDMSRLPKLMRFTRRALPMEEVVASHR